MKNIYPALLNHYKQEETTLAQIFKLTLRNGEVMGFTSFDEDILMDDGVVYKAFSGMTPSAVSSTSQFNVDNLSVEGFLEDDRITEADLKYGKYDYADVIIAELNWNDEPYDWSKTNIKRVGKLGEVKIQDGKFSAEIRGLQQELANKVGVLYQTTCRARFGDNRCGVNTDNYSELSSVDTITNNLRITANLTAANGYYNGGSILFTSGLNTGLVYEVKSTWGNIIDLQIPANYVIAVGDTFKIVRGCNKTIKTCQDIFGNAVNFRGEPYIPSDGEVINK